MARTAEELKIKISAQDKASPKLKLVGKELGNVSEKSEKAGVSLKGMGVAFAAVTAAAGVVALAIKKAVDAFAIQELAVQRVSSALQIAGVSSAAYTQRLVDQAGALQQVTRFGDETILEMQSFLITFGLLGKELEETTKLTIDMSVALGVDLKASALLMGKAFTGEISSLSRYGIKIKEGLAESEKFNAVLDVLRNTMGGRARAEAGTVSGATDQMTNAIGDFIEEVGKAVVANTPWIDSLKALKFAAERATLAIGGGTALAQIDFRIERQEKLLRLQREAIALQLGGFGVGELAGGLAAVQNLRELEKERNKILKILKKENEEIDRQLKIVFDRNEATKAAAELEKMFQGIIEDNAELLELERKITFETVELFKEKVKLSQEELDLLNAQADALKRQAELGTLKGVSENLGTIGGVTNLGITAAGGQATFATGSGALAGIGSVGVIVAAVVGIAEAINNLPDLLRGAFGTVTEALSTGIFDAIDFLTNEFLTEVIPNLIAAMAKLFLTIIPVLVKALADVIANIPSLLGGIVKGIGSTFKDIGSFVGGLFGGGGEDARGPIQKGLEKLLESGVDANILFTELSETMNELTFQTLENTVLKIDFLTFELDSFGRKFDDLAQAFIDAGDDTEKLNEVFDLIVDNVRTQIGLLEQRYDLEIKRIDDVIRAEEQRVAVEIRAQEELMANFERLQGAAIATIQNAIVAIRGALLSPEANVAQLRTAFAAAGTPEARSAAASALAGGLQGQFGAAQALAAQGAITGEELERIQRDVLAELEALEVTTQTEFDLLIEATNREIQAINEGFDRFVAEQEQTRDELTAILRDQIAELSLIRELLERSTGEGGFNFGTSQQAFDENQGNIRGSIGVPRVIG